jgi:hypothetical protein
MHGEVGSGQWVVIDEWNVKLIALRHRRIFLQQMTNDNGQLTNDQYHPSD